MVPSDKPKNKFEHFQEEQKGIRDGNKKKKKNCLLLAHGGK